MINVVVFEVASGRISRTMRLVDATEADLNCRPGEDWVEGTADMSRQWVASGLIIDLPAAELSAADLVAAWVALRAERDRRLTSTDWTQVADAPVNKAAWAAYRAALRALPENTTDPLNPVWPVAPGSEET